MKIERIAITGDQFFLKRRVRLVEAMRDRVTNVDVAETGTYYTSTLIGLMQFAYYVVRYRRSGDGGRWKGLLYKTRRGFVNHSRQAAQIVNSLPNRPDHVLHLHAMYAPCIPGEKPSVPYSIFTDYTGALSDRNWTPWASVGSPEQRREWTECQRIAYAGASHIFTYSGIARDSIRDDYGISEEKVTVVGHGGDMRKVFDGDKPFGAKQLLLNGSDWPRKGGDIALDAFRLVHDRIPEAKLVVIGCPPQEPALGVEYRGSVSNRDELHKLFLESDVLLCPARCDPLPTFGVEAMSFGVPVVVSGRDGMPEMVDFGRCGSIASLDARSVADAVLELLQNDTLLREKSDAARERVRSHYNWDTITQRMVETWAAMPDAPP